MSTIVAISTAPTIGGIGIIRISGDKSFEIIDKIFVPKNKSNQIKGYSMKYGKIINQKDLSVVDEVIVSFFKAPKSYTTENMCEINSHGGIAVVKEILNLCLANGAELAEPGEFTKRAFLNGRIDLAQAEATIDIINAKSKKETQAAVKQLEGALSFDINNIKKDILKMMAYMEADIDYPEYDTEELTKEQIKNGLEEVKEKLYKLLKTFDNGKIIKDGIKTAIIGSPNAGKSSLLNAILKEDRAIVSEVEGTTRDTIEEFVTVCDVPLKIIDTAGIRNSENIVEKIGIEKTKKIADESDLIIAVFDSSKELAEEDLEILKIIKDKKAIIVLNKIDLNQEKLQLSDENKKVVKISALNNQGIEQIYDEIVKLYNLNEINIDNQTMITNIRHKNLIQDAINNANEAMKSLENNMPTDIVAINIKEILENLSLITGESVSEDIIKEIFSRFCLGK